MTMELGSGIAIAGLGISSAGIVIVAITRAFPSKGTETPPPLPILGNGGKGVNDFIKILCDERHKTIDKQLDTLCAWMKEIDTKLDSLLRRPERKS